MSKADAINDLKGYYHNLEYIGTGSFVSVYKATDNDGRIVAIKVPLF
jgi:serine/threonine protein kinase